MAPLQNLRKFVAPEFIFGAGARHLAGRYAHNFGGRKALIVTDRGVSGAGWVRDVALSLEQEGLKQFTFRNVSANPRAEEVADGARVFREQGCNLIVAVGGGSPMDCAKGIGIMATHGNDILAFQGIDLITQAIPPLICIPTTSGTGADLSQFAIITDRRERVKVAIISKALVPDISLVDPETLASMPPYLTACVGLDALTHAVEAFVSNAHSPMTDLHALEAIRLLNAHLADAVHNPADVQLRTQVMLGSHYAGLAFSNAILGAAHAMAHSLGGYLDLPHGECNAILLDRVIEFNYPAAPERFDRIAAAMDLDMRGLIPKKRRKTLVARIAELKEQVGLSRQLAGLGVSRSDIQHLSAKAIADPCLITNPRPAVRQDLDVLYEEAL